MDRADQVALRFTLDELRQEPGPEDHGGLAPLLLAGYLTLAERLCRSRNDERAGLYVLASRALERWFGPVPVD